MAFSSSFFTIDPNETSAADGTEENTENSDSKMSLDNGRPKLGEQEDGPPAAQQQQQQQQQLGGGSNSSDNSKPEQQQSDQLSRQPSPVHQRSNSVLPPTQPDKQQQPQNTENNPTTSDQVDQLVSEDNKSAMAPDGKKLTKVAAPAALKKKKGTATTVKTPGKRSRPGGSTGKKKKSRKADETSTSGPQNGDESAAGAGAGDDEDSGSDQESDSGPYCLCRGPDNHRFMIACDKCQDWFHGECIGMDKFTGENLVQKYICPNCSDGKRYVTRYKKMCALDGCSQPARIYDPEKPSVFCSQEHCQAWWERMVASLPREKIGSLDNLTQKEFVGLLDPTPRSPGAKPSTWKVTDDPFGVEPDFWEKVDLEAALTQEERDILDSSTTERYRINEEITFRKKMLLLMEYGLKQRETAIAAGILTKDVCGYDSRLDTVNVLHQFVAFYQSPEGETIFKTGRLELPSELASGVGGTMCIKKKCKTHHQWGAILTKSVKHSIKELARQAKELADSEARIRENAAGRFRRKQLEGNTVTVFDSSSDDESGDDDGPDQDVEMG